MALLAATPQRLAATCAGVPGERLRERPAPDEWSANEVLAHLRACADARGGVIPLILAEHHPTLRAVNPLTWIKKTDYLDLEFEPSLRAFSNQRAELLTLLEPLPTEAWSRSATFTGAGRPLERTVLFYGQWLARHERPHVKQVERIVGALKR